MYRDPLTGPIVCTSNDVLEDHRLLHLRSCAITFDRLTLKTLALFVLSSIAPEDDKYLSPLQWNSDVDAACDEISMVLNTALYGNTRLR